jgi:hypothetical protein
MRVRLKGLNSITKTLADGSKRTYYYAWKGGPPLHGKPGSPEFIHAYNEAIARKVLPPRGTLLSVLRAYQASEDFLGLADSTRRSYVALILRIEKEFSDYLPLLLALWTGQRQGDLLRLPWSAYDGKYIRLRQSKGGSV